MLLPRHTTANWANAATRNLCHELLRHVQTCQDWLQTHPTRWTTTTVPIRILFEQTSYTTVLDWREQLSPWHLHRNLSMHLSLSTGRHLLGVRVKTNVKSNLYTAETIVNTTENIYSNAQETTHLNPVYVGHLESKERLRIQQAQLFHFSWWVMWCVQ